MKALYALTAHNIDFAQQALNKLKDCPKVSVLNLDHKIEAPNTQSHVLLIPTVQVLKRNARVLNDCPNIVVIVFDAPVLCKEIGAEMLDIEKQTLDYKFTYRRLEHRDVNHAVKAALNGPGGVKIKKATIDMSTKLLKRVYGSILGKFLTFMYKVPDTDKRQELQRLVFAAWWNNDMDSLRKALEKRYAKNAAAQEFLAHLDAADGTAFLAAVQRMRELREAGKPVPYAKLSKDFKVSAYDLKYYAKGLQK